MLDTALGTKGIVMNKINKISLVSFTTNKVPSYFSLVLPYEFSHSLFLGYGRNVLRNAFFILKTCTELFNSFDSLSIKFF